MKSCLKCGLGVWIGDVKCTPTDIQPAHPLDQDWTDAGEPYCESCWNKESEILDGMGGSYKAAGKCTKPKTKKKKQPKKKTTKKPKKKTKKKQLGGVQGPLLVHAAAAPTPDEPAAPTPDEPAVPAPPKFQVGQTVNARFKTKYYGAFISKVNCDYTYDVYFYESSEVTANVPEADIKLPLVVRSNRSTTTWSNYVGRVFFDEGTPGEFEAGEFRVESVTRDNNFWCVRVGEEDDRMGEDFDIGYTIKRIRKYEEE